MGDVQSASGDYVSYLTINGCTIAALGNTQGLAMQTSSTFTLNNVTITNNYWAGFGYTLQIGASYPSTPPTNYVFTGNVIGATPKAVYGPLYSSQAALFGVSGSGNKWRNNTYAGSTYASIGTVPAGYYMWPDGTAHATDWTGAY